MSGCDQGSDVQIDSRDDDKANVGPPELDHPTEDMTRSPCSGARQVAEMVQGQKTVLDLFVVDANGVAVNLAGADHARYIAKDRTTSNTAYFDVLATVVDADAGKVRVSLTPEDVPEAGIFESHVLVYNAADALLWLTPYWLAINPSLDAPPDKLSGMITMAEVRMKLRDVCAGQNVLLDDFEFDDTQLMWAMRWPIDEFNETNQPKTNYTPRNFPWRYHWLLATCGYLLEISARGYARDHLPYSAGGVSVDDKNKASTYQQLANRVLSQWRQFVVDQKIQLNVSSAFGTLRSPYSYYGYR